MKNFYCQFRNRQKGKIVFVKHVMCTQATPKGKYFIYVLQLKK